MPPRSPSRLSAPGALVVTGVAATVAVARGMVEAHGGEPDVRHRPAGCRFTVRLPPNGRV